jgi:hypothetical protein
MTLHVLTSYGTLVANRAALKRSAEREEDYWLARPSRRLSRA